MTPKQVDQHADSIVRIHTTSGPLLLFNNKKLPQNVVDSAPDVAQLLQERDRLRQENEFLQCKVSLFQQLFRNKERLTSVLKRLGFKAEYVGI